MTQRFTRIYQIMGVFYVGKKVEDSKLLEMLLVHGGVSGAAAVLGISRNAIYRRLRDDDFRAEYDKLQGILLSTAAAGMADSLSDAIGLLRGVINDEDANINSRVSAADSLLRHTVRYVEIASVLRRLEALENAANT